MVKHNDPNWNLDGEVIPPTDYPLPKAERRPEYDDSMGFVCIGVSWLLGVIVGVLGTLWFITLP